MVTAAAGVAGLAALASLRRTAEAQARVFPPAPPAVSPVEGLIDFHTHCAPDVFGRSIDDESAQGYMARKAEGVVLKNQVTSTGDRAWLLKKHNPGIKANTSSSPPTSARPATPPSGTATRCWCRGSWARVSPESRS